MNIIQQLEAEQAQEIAAKREIPEFGPGDTVVVAGQERLRDGQQVACELRSLQVRVWIEGELARTEMEQVFANPLPSDQEGTFDFELPPGAAVNRLALEIDGKLVEGDIKAQTTQVMVERPRIRLRKAPVAAPGDRQRNRAFRPRRPRRARRRLFLRKTRNPGRRTCRPRRPKRGR